MPDVRVTVVNTDTRFTRTDKAGGDGAFLFPLLPIGTYKLTVEKAGFSTYVQEGITLTVNQAASQTVTLQVGSTTYCGYNCQGGVYPTEQEASVNGGGTANVNYQMDGAGHNDSFMNMNLPFPNPDAIQEFNLQSSNMSAEYGNSAAVVNIVTKSGTNSFHGVAFEFVRNADMNARNFFAPTQDTLGNVR